MIRRLCPGDPLVVATHNEGKLGEIRTMLAPHGIACVGARALGLAEPAETAPDFVGNARLKALAAATASGMAALADDSGFCVAALGGAPGLFSARWAGAGRDFGQAMARVHEAVGANPDRRAWFVCALVLAWPDGVTASFQGRVDGGLVWPPRGDHGFGYDPVFVPLGDSRTYAEMGVAAKEADSHRARAFAQMAIACLPARA